MFKPLFGFLFSIIIAFSATGQTDLSGKWYMFSRNRLIEFNIAGDSIVNRQLGWDMGVFNPHDSPQVTKIIGRGRNKGKIYLYLRGGEEVRKGLGLMTFQVIVPNKRLLFVASAPDSSFKDTMAIHQYIQADTGKVFGFPLFGEGELLSMRSQKDIGKMTAADFNQFVAKMLTSQSTMDSLEKLSLSASVSNSLLYMSYSRLREIVGELGYDPLFGEGKLDAVMRRFKDDPQTSEMYKKID